MQLIRIKLCLFVFALLLQTFVFATTTKEFKHTCIAKIIQFINTDTTAFRTPVKLAYKGNNIADLKKHYASLPKVSNKIDEINAVSINETTPQKLQETSLQFIEKAIASISSNEKAYRTKLSNFNNLQKELEHAQAEFIASNSNNNGISLPPPSPSTTAPAVTVVGDPSNGSSTIDETANTSIWRKLDYLLLALPILLSLLLYFLLKQKNTNKAMETKGNNEELEQHKKTIQTELDKIKLENKTLVEKINSINEEIKGIKEFLKKLGDPNQLDNTKNNTDKNSTSASTNKQQEIVQKQSPKIVYAEQLDTNNGFSLRSLKENSTNTSIFKIMLLNENEATFEINTDSSVQSYAVRNFANYISSNLAVFQTIPTDINNKIVTTKPGKLALRNNVWEITTKVEISIR